MILYLQTIESDSDRSKFEAIYQEYRNLMYHVAYQYTKNTQDAEDIVQHTFLKIAENIKKIEPVSPKTKQYVVTMVEHRAIDLYRQRTNTPLVTSLEEELCPMPVQPELEEGDLLSQCIFQLPAQYRQVIWLKYCHGYSLREIASMLDISLAWAQKLDQRAKKKLEALYREAGGTF